jgi:hypothetical protein
VADTGPCNEVPDPLAEENDGEGGYGIYQAVFFRGGGIAYACEGDARIVDTRATASA